MDVMGGAVVQDNVTSLVWEDHGTTPPASSSTWQAAKDRCEALTLGGSCDWRLPSRIELISILDVSKASAPLIDDLFRATQAGQYWTASTTPPPAWSVNFQSGETTENSVTTALWVRCVRGGTALSGQHYLVGEGAASGSVLDQGTGLRWERDASESQHDFAQATNYCTSRTTGGFDDWRLPSITELQTLVDESRGGPAWDTAVFPGGTAATLSSSWTSSVAGSSLGWTVDFIDGRSHRIGRISPLFVRCVR
jgi:hypothetical protein